MRQTINVLKLLKWSGFHRPNPTNMSIGFYFGIYGHPRCFKSVIHGTINRAAYLPPLKYVSPLERAGVIENTSQQT